MQENSNSERDLSGPESPHFTIPDADAKAEANGWEEIAEGRYMPKRNRGSCHGRALG